MSTADYSTKMEIEITTLAAHQYKLYREHIQVASGLPSTDPYYVDSQLLSGSAFCYSCSAKLNGQSDWLLQRPSLPTHHISHPPPSNKKLSSSVSIHLSSSGSQTIHLQCVIRDMQKLQYMKYKQNLKPETCGCGVDLFSV